MSVLAVRDLHKSFGGVQAVAGVPFDVTEGELLAMIGLNAFYGGAHILFDLSLSVGRGEVAVLLGRNGAGKSTTLKSIAGLVRPASGTIAFEGEGVAGLPPYRIVRRGLGYVPEDRRIFTDLTVMENLEVGRWAKGAGWHDEDWPRSSSIRWRQQSAN